MFKNIQNDAVAKLIGLYESTGKQVFMAIDEIEKYGEIATLKLKDKKVIKLHNENVLYVKDWRKWQADISKRCTQTHIATLVFGV